VVYVTGIIGQKQSDLQHNQALDVISDFQTIQDQDQVQHGFASLNKKNISFAIKKV